MNRLGYLVALIIGLGLLTVGGIKFWSNAHGGFSALGIGLAIFIGGFLIATWREILGGLLILLGLSTMVFIIAGHWSATPSGVVMVLLGLVISLGALFLLLKGRPGSAEHAMAEIDTFHSGSMEITLPPPTMPERTATPKTETFIIIENIENTVLDDVERLLAEDPNVVRVSSENGRHYSVPDGDDLPEWFALHVACAPGTRNKVMHTIGESVTETLGKSARSKIQMREL